MSNQLIDKKNTNVESLEAALVGGDLSKLSSMERLQLIKHMCDNLGLNPLTKPFDYITMNGKLTLYATKGCTDQLRKIHGVSIEIKKSEIVDGVLTVWASAKTADGRVDEDCGSLTIGTLKGDALANARMKAVTKAKRRVTLSICGLNFLDEIEIETVAGARRFQEKEMPLPQVKEEIKEVSIQKLASPADFEATLKQAAIDVAIAAQAPSELRIVEPFRVEAQELKKVDHVDYVIQHGRYIGLKPSEMDIDVLLAYSTLLGENLQSANLDPTRRSQMEEIKDEVDYQIMFRK